MEWCDKLQLTLDCHQTRGPPRDHQFLFPLTSWETRWNSERYHPLIHAMLTVAHCWVIVIIGVYKWSHTLVSWEGTENADVNTPKSQSYDNLTTCWYKSEILNNLLIPCSLFFPCRICDVHSSKPKSKQQIKAYDIVWLLPPQVCNTMEYSP